MEHLRALTNKVDKRIRVPYLCSNAEYDGQGFWDFPRRQGWDPYLIYASLEMGLFSKIFRAKRTSSPSAAAALLQAWWYFGMLHEVLGASVVLEDFITPPERTRTQYITTKAIEDSIKAFHRRLKQLPLQEASAILEQGIRCVNHVHISVENLAKRIEDSLKKLPKGESERSYIRGMELSEGGRISITGTTLLDIIAHAKANPCDSVNQSWNGAKMDMLSAAQEDIELMQLRIYGREILSHDLEVSICVLGYTLSHSLKSISLKLGLTSAAVIENRGWYIPASIHRRIVLNGLCPRVVHRLEYRLLLGGAYYLSLLEFGPEPPFGTHHVDCTKDLCVADRLKDGINPKSHAVPNCDCGNVAEDLVLQKVMTIIEQGETPILRLVASSEDDLDIEFAPAHGIPYAAISHVWSDGLGNSEANELFSCQWRRVQSLVDDVFPHDFKPTSTPFWLDIICIPVYKNINHTADQCRRRKLREASIQRMRQIYCEADHVLIVDAYGPSDLYTTSRLN